MKTTRIVGIAMVLLTLFGVPLFGQEVTVTATGYGTGAEGTAISEATEDALRKAVEQGCGVFIQSKSVTKNFVLIKDQIISESKGFVSGHSIVSKRYDPRRATAEVTIKATVSKKLLISKWALYEATMARVGKPKVMFVTQLIHGSKVTNSKEAENNLRQPFIDARVFVVDKEALAAAKATKLQVANADSDMNAMVAIGSELGADVIVRGKVTGELSSRTNPYGGAAPYWTYVFNYQFNIIRVSDSRTLHSFSDNFKTSFKTRGSPTEAFRLGADRWSRKVGPYLRRKLMEFWAFMAQNYITFHLEIRGVKFTHAKKIRQWLKKQPWAKNVWQDRFRKGIVVLRVESKLSVETFMDKITDQKVVPLEIVDNNKTNVQAKLASDED